MMKTPSLRFSRSFILAPLIAASTCHAALLVHEGFGGYTDGELNGQGASPSSLGLSGTWVGSSYTTRHQITGTGLTFAGLATSGGALTIGTSTRLSGIAMSHAGVAAGGTLYSSYLVRQDTAATSGSGIVTRINGTSETTTNGYYSAFTDGRSSSLPAVGYDGTFNPANHNISSSTLSVGETYIVISSFTNVGNASPGDANLYVLNQAQYTNLLTVGIGSLGSLAVGTGSNQVWASASQTGSTFNGSFDSTDFLHILSLDTTGTIDELRYGTALAEVLPVPEPSGLLLTGVALAGLATRRTTGRR